MTVGDGVASVGESRPARGHLVFAVRLYGPDVQGIRDSWLGVMGVDTRQVPGFDGGSGSQPVLGSDALRLRSGGTAPERAASSTQTDLAMTRSGTTRGDGGRVERDTHASTASRAPLRGCRRARRCPVERRARPSHHGVHPWANAEPAECIELQLAGRCMRRDPPNKATPPASLRYLIQAFGDHQRWPLSAGTSASQAGSVTGRRQTIVLTVLLAEPAATVDCVFRDRRRSLASCQAAPAPGVQRSASSVMSSETRRTGATPPSGLGVATARNCRAQAYK